MKRKLLALDLDGTAVKDDYSMSISSIQAIKKAKEYGHIVSFITGRRDVDMLTLGPEQWGVNYHILNNGGKIVRCIDKKIMMNQTIDSNTSKVLINHCLKEGVQLHICNGMVWQVTKMTEGTMNYAKKVGVVPEVISKLNDVVYENIEGFMATSDAEPVGKYIDECLPKLCYIHSEPGTIDIMANGVSKYNGIKALAEIEGIDNKDIIAVGNYYNDIDMIVKSGTGIAVANSLQPVKDAADYVTKEDNNHDAVKEIIDLIIEGAFN